MGSSSPNFGELRERHRMDEDWQRTLWRDFSWSFMGEVAGRSEVRDVPHQGR